MGVESLHEQIMMYFRRIMVRHDSSLPSNHSIRGIRIGASRFGSGSRDHYCYCTSAVSHDLSDDLAQLMALFSIPLRDARVLALRPCSSTIAGNTFNIFCWSKRCRESSHGRKESHSFFTMLETELKTWIVKPYGRFSRLGRTDIIFMLTSKSPSHEFGQQCCHRRALE